MIDRRSEIPPQHELDSGYLEWREALWEGAGREVRQGWTRQIDVAASSAYVAAAERGHQDLAEALWWLAKVHNSDRSGHRPEICPICKVGARLQLACEAEFLARVERGNRP